MDVSICIKIADQQVGNALLGILNFVHFYFTLIEQNV